MDNPPGEPPNDAPPPATLRERYDTARSCAGRSKTLSEAAMKRQLRDMRRERTLEDPTFQRPVTRADCEHAERPCPFVGCKYHLYLDVTDNGSLKLNFPDREPGELVMSCALDLADHGGITLEAAGMAMNLTRERVRQMEAKALLKLQDGARALDADRRQLRHLPIIDADTIELLDELDESA